MGLAGAAIGAGVAGAAATGITGAIGSSNASSAAKSAAAQQAQSEQNASALSVQSLGNVATALTPYTNEGAISAQGLQNALVNGTYQTGTGYLDNATGYLGQAAGAYGAAQGDVSSANSIYNSLQNGMSQQTLDNTPGYQFTLNQGLESTQNAAAARGLGSSGAALKDAATYATGLANSTYMNEANVMLGAASGYQSSAGNENSAGAGYGQEANSSIGQQASLLDTNNQNFGQLLSGTGVGLQAAGAYAGAVGNTGNTIAGNTTAAGNATASGTVGAANATNAGLGTIGSAVSGLGSNLTQSLLLQNLLGGGGLFGSSGNGGFSGSPYSTGYQTIG